MKKPVAFITGVAGFAGSWLAEELLCENYRVVGGLFENEPVDNLSLCSSDITLLPLDITDPDQVAATLRQVKPDYIFHLAAIASVARSFRSERLTYRVNFEGTLNMLAAAREVTNLKKFVFVGSCDAYGVIMPKNRTLTEDDPFNPISPYGISKASAEYLCRQYVRRYDLPVAIARPFNHAGPRQAPDFVVSDFARQVAAIDLGLQRPEIHVGNLAPKRDFSDVRDIVRGYHLVAEQGRPGQAYHLCSGRAVSIGTVLKTLTGLTSKKVAVAVDKDKLRKADIPVLRGSNRRAIEELGFAVRYRLKETLRDTFAWWQELLTAQNRKG